MNEEIQQTKEKTEALEKEFKATAKKVNKDYTLYLRMIRVKYGDA